MKKYVLVGAAVIVTACVFPLFAQSAGGGSDTLPRLLVEVRALRIAVEKAASAAPQVQLLAARLTVQNERLTRAAHEADAAHLEVEKLQRDAASFAADAAELEEALTRETDPPKQQLLKQRQRGVKQQLEAIAAAEASLRAREAELANVLATEQIQWAELNRRFDELERVLAARTPQ